MIRSVQMPRGVNRIGGVILPGQTALVSSPDMQVPSPGSIGIGSGGSYTSYSFDPTTGLSNDPMLAYYLQDLTPAQLQSALNGGASVTQDLSSLLIDEQTGTGAGALPSGAALSSAASAIPMWAWIAGGGVLAFALLKR